MESAHRRRLYRSGSRGARNSHGEFGRKTPATVWSATPLFVNDTVYLGTPFYRIFALEPDTGKVKWTYDTKAVLQALTQPDLKNRGVAYWQAEKPVARCRVPEANLYRHDGREAACGRCRYGQSLRRTSATTALSTSISWNTVNNKWPLSILQPPTVFQRLLVRWLGRQGLG